MFHAVLHYSCKSFLISKLSAKYRLKSSPDGPLKRNPKRYTERYTVGTFCFHKRYMLFWGEGHQWCSQTRLQTRRFANQNLALKYIRSQTVMDSICWQRRQGVTC